MSTIEANPKRISFWISRGITILLALSLLAAFLPEPAIVEIIGNCGFDFIIFDMEHAPLGILEIERLIRDLERKLKM